MFRIVYEEPATVGVYEPRTKIVCPGDLAKHMDWLNAEVQEHFCSVTLNGAGEIITSRILMVGVLNHAPVHPREVFAPAITDRAASIILIHNHPSGNPEPSPQDVSITKQLAKAGDILGIKVVDHIITASRGVVSLRERGLF